MPSFSTLRRSRNNKMIAGVCSGIAGWLGWDTTLVRILFIVGSVIPVVPGFVVYLILWLLLPQNTIDYLLSTIIPVISLGISCLDFGAYNFTQFGACPIDSAH